MSIEVYVDGACSGNGKEDSPGGWAVVFTDGREFGGGETNTTNQRMELRAAIEALHRTEIGVSVTIHSDSAYLVNCFRDGWYKNWERNGWRNSQKQPVANQDLWQELLRLVRARQVTWEKVKGHAGQEFNERADRLAVASIPR